MWLALETSADRASVAVGQPGQVTVEASLEGARKHAGALPGLIEQVLARAGVELAAVEAVVLGDGPGKLHRAPGGCLRGQGAGARARHGLAHHALAGVRCLVRTTSPVRAGAGRRQRAPRGTLCGGVSVS